MSHGQATRSIFGRRRVTQTVGLSPSVTPRAFTLTVTAGAGRLPAVETMLERLGGDAALSQARHDALAAVVAVRAATTTTGRGAAAVASAIAASRSRRREAGMMTPRSSTSGRRVTSMTSGGKRPPARRRDRERR